MATAQAPLNQLHVPRLLACSHKTPDKLKQPGYIGGRFGSRDTSHRCAFADLWESQRISLWRLGVAGGRKSEWRQLCGSRRTSHTSMSATGETRSCNDFPSGRTVRSLPKTLICSALLLLTSASSVLVVLPLEASAETVLSQPATPKPTSSDLGGISVPLFVAPGTSSYYGSVSDVPNPRLHGGWVVDDARVMSEAQKAHIERVAQRVREASGAEIAVVTVDQISKSTSPKSFATSLFNEWGIGSAQENNGVLVFLVKDRRRLEIGIGRGLNGPFNKASWLKKMQQERMVPLLKANDFGGGLVSGVDALAEKLSLIKADPQDSTPADGSDADGRAGSLLLFVLGGWLVIDRINVDRESSRKQEELARAQSLREQEMECEERRREARAAARLEEQEAREASRLQAKGEQEETQAEFWREVNEARAAMTPEERRKDEEARAEQDEEEARVRKKREKERKEKEARKKEADCGTGSYTGSGSSYAGSSRSYTGRSSSYDDSWYDSGSSYGGSSYGRSSTGGSSYGGSFSGGSSDGGSSYGGSSYGDDSSSSSSSDSGFDGGSSDGGGGGSDF